MNYTKQIFKLAAKFEKKADESLYQLVENLNSAVKKVNLGQFNQHNPFRDDKKDESIRKAFSDIPIVSDNYRTIASEIKKIISYYDENVSTITNNRSMSDASILNANLSVINNEAVRLNKLLNELKSLRGDLAKLFDITGLDTYSWSQSPNIGLGYVLDDPKDIFNKILNFDRGLTESAYLYKNKYKELVDKLSLQSKTLPKK